MAMNPHGHPLRRFALGLMLAAAAWASKPVITGIQPRAAAPGQLVLLRGDHFRGVTGGVVGLLRFREIEIIDDYTMVFRIPTDGEPRMMKSSIFLNSPGGLGQSYEKFTLLPRPSIRKPTRVRPVILATAQRPGNRIIVYGAELDRVSSLELASTPDVPFMALDPSTLVFQLPPADLETLREGRVLKTLFELKGPHGSARAFLRVLPAGRAPAAPAGEPALTGFQPASGRSGDRVVLTGTGLDRVTRLELGETEIPLFAASPGRVVCQVPFLKGADLPQRRHWRLTFAPGTAGGAAPVRTSQLAFEALARPPLVTGIRPQAGCIGTPLVISGWDFGSPDRPATAVRVGEGRTTHFLKNTDREIWVQVPAGASSGPVTVETAEGPAEAQMPFTVLPKAAPALRLASALITQAVQSQDGSVPLVAGRAGLLRVFVLADTGNMAVPVVRATLRDARGEIVLRRIVAGWIPGVPTEIDEDNLESSWNLAIPGELIQPGLTLQAELLATEAGEPLAAIGPREVPVLEVPTLGITLVPVRWGGAVGNVDQDGRRLEDWLRLVRKLYPVGAIDARVGPELDASQAEGTAAEVLGKVVEALEARRLRDDPGNTRFYYGVVKLPAEDEQALGLTRSGGRPGHLNRTAAGWDGSDPATGGTCFHTFAHELGHCFARSHTPAGSPANIDPHYPQPDGRLDAAGLDVQLLQPKPRDACTDIMGYGVREGQWVSAYTWKGVLAYLRLDPMAHPDLAGADGTGTPFPPEAGAPVETKEPAPAQSSLLVAGTIEHGQVRWHPVFELPGPAPRPGAGDYRLRFLDRAGRSLLELPFEAPPVADLPGDRQARAFSLLVPLSADLRKRLANIEILHGSKRLAITPAWGPAGVPLPPRRRPAPGGRQRDPVEVVSYRPGTASLRWEPREHPALLVRDPRDGAIIARVEGGRAEVHTDAPELEFIRSDGWDSDIITVPVRDYRGPARTDPAPEPD